MNDLPASRKAATLSSLSSLSSLTAWLREGLAWSLITAMPGLVAAVLVVAPAVGPRDRLRPGAVALACAPWLIQPLTGDLYDAGFSGVRYVLLTALAIVLVLAVGHRQHRNRLSAERATPGSGN